MNAKVTLPNYSEAVKTLTLRDIEGAEGIYISQSHPRSRIVTLLNGERELVTLYVGDGLIQPLLSESFKTYSFIKVEEEMSISFTPNLS